MRTAITLAFRHGKTAGEIIKGPAEKVQAHKDALKELGRSPTHPEFSRVEVWESDLGRSMSRDFKSPKEFEAKAKNEAKVLAEVSDPTDPAPETVAEAQAQPAKEAAGDNPKKRFDVSK